MMKEQLQKNEKIIELGRGNYSALYDNAGIYSFLGESQKAIESLRKYDETSIWKSGNVYFIQVDPLFDNIRERSEYQEIVNNRLVANISIIEEINGLEEHYQK